MRASEGAEIVCSAAPMEAVLNRAASISSRRRYRGGLGYRHNRHWQTAALYIRTNSRNTIDEPFTTSENVLDLQLKRVW
jgi:hypothetical protein